MNFGLFCYICKIYLQHTMKKLTLLLIVLFGCCQAQAQTLQDLQNGYNKYARLLYYINNNYVDTANIKKLVEKAMVTTLQNLDPHSTYLSAEEVKAANEPLEGSFDGIGVEFNILNDTLTIVGAISGGPSEKVGIIAGDRILSVNKENIAGIGLKNDQVMKLLRGPKGTSVELGILRKGTKTPITFVVVRDKIPIFSLDAAYEIKPGMVYIRLNKFAVTTMDEINTAVAKFKRKPTAMILDLRGNSGGVLQASIELADQFFDKGKLLLYTEGSHWRKTMDISTGNGFFKTGKLAVLIDEGSASASEIVTGAIQDWDRGIVIGRRSYGKGLVQQLMPLPDGSQVRLTVARYHTPTGRVIQRPYDAGHLDKYYADLYKRYTDGEVYNQDSIKFPDSLKYYTLKEKRVVYGGGGIMPDVFMPMDTSYYSTYYSKMLRTGILNQFSLRSMDQHRDKLKKQYSTFDKFDKQFEVSDVLFEELLTYAEEQKLPRDADGIKISGNNMRTTFKAYIARVLWGTSEYFQVVNKRDDKIFIKTVELLDKKD